MPVRIDVIRHFKKQPERSVPVSLRGRELAEQALAYSIDENTKARERLLQETYARNFGVVFFGSARFEPGDPETKIVEDVASLLTRERPIDTITGGGPGIMHAASKSAKEAIERVLSTGKNLGQRTIGSRIQLPFEEETNPFLDVVTTHAEFSTRIQEMVDLSHSAYVGQGGFGTLLELATLLQQKQVGHLEPGYLIIADPWWKDIIKIMHKKMYYDRKRNKKRPFIDPKDLHLIKFTNNTNTIVNHIVARYDQWDKNEKVKTVQPLHEGVWHPISN